MEFIPILVHPGAEWINGTYSPLLYTAIILAGLGTITLFVIGLVAYLHRRTFQLFLITIALSALVVRSIVGLGTILGIVPMPIHHFVEHGLDFLIAALILYAVYMSGSPQPRHLTDITGGFED